MPMAYCQGRVWCDALVRELGPSFAERAVQWGLIGLINSQPALKVEDYLVATLVLHQFVPVAPRQCLYELRLLELTLNFGAGKAI